MVEYYRTRCVYKVECSDTNTTQCGGWFTDSLSPIIAPNTKLFGWTSQRVEEKQEIIDEIESSLHPDLVQHFLLEHLVHSTRSQLLVTTHNIFLLDNKDILCRDAIWFTQKRDDGSTELFSLADFDSDTLRSDASIINHYKIGKLGAKPRLGNIFLK